MKVPNKPILRELLAEGKDHQGQIGSMEFACKIAGSKLLVVLGHTKCGAVKGACDNVEMGNLTELLSKLGPAVYQETTTAGADKRNSSNEEFVENVATINVKRSVKAIVERSYILEQMIEQGEIAIIGAMYNLETGLVEFYQDKFLSDANGIKTIRHPGN